MNSVGFFLCQRIGLRDSKENSKAETIDVSLKYGAGWWLGHPSEKYERQLG